MCCRARSVGALLGGALLVAALAGPASAVPTPEPTPTPSVSPPSQQQIDDAKAALERLRNQGTTTPARVRQVAGPATVETKEGGITSRISDEAWWTLGAGLLVLVVASETTRISVRRAKHRKGA